MDVKEFFGEVISTYTSKQAIEDGVLHDITELNPAWKNGIFNYVTASLLSRGYFEKDGSLRVVNIIDLLNQTLQIVKRRSKNFTEHDSFFSGHIELPNGKEQQIFMAQNETGKFTIMLPEDY